MPPAAMPPAAGSAAPSPSAAAAAHSLARAYEGGCHHDGYLPSRDELSMLYLNRDVIGDCSTASASGVQPPYWNSSEYENAPYCARYQYFDDGYQNNNYKGCTYRVRAVRAF